ncbi:hypothetical protein OSTOST_08975, partial [Ostertagia ostertagi]
TDYEVSQEYGKRHHNRKAFRSQSDKCIKSLPDVKLTLQLGHVDRGAPFSPFLPGRPGGPYQPTGPIGPIGPASPGGPGGPAG